MRFFHLKIRKLQFLSRGNLKKERKNIPRVDPTSVVVVVACFAYKFPLSRSQEELKLHPMEVEHSAVIYGE